MKNHPHLICHNETIYHALEKLNKVGSELILFVIDSQDKLIGTLTDGDIRRSLIKGLTTKDLVTKSMNKNFKYLKQCSFSLIEFDMLRKQGLKMLPIVDQSFEIKRLVNLREIRSILPVDAVIMAGGKGERLRPLTADTPKPLLKVGEKPIIERNIERIWSYGVSNITISVRYLGEKLIEYFTNEFSKENLKISFVEEKKPLGTIGALSIVKDFTHDYLLLMNSDLLTDIDFEDFFRDFIDQGADMSIASYPYKVEVPYAIMETSGKEVLSFKEKPTYTMYSNAGIYLIKKELIKYIPKSKFFDATDFMKKLIEKKRKVISYPILGYWLDIGRHEDYLKAQEDIKRIKF